MLQSAVSEVWVELHYRYKGELFQFNLPLHRGEKYLDGLRIDFSYEDTDGGRRFRVDLEPLGTIEMESLELTGGLPLEGEARSVFVNGYQSWTGSRERSPGERISGLDWPGRLISMQRFGDDRFYRYSEKKGRFHGYSYCYLRHAGGLLFTGSLNEAAGYTIFTVDVRRKIFTITKDVQGLRLSGRRLMLDLVLLEGPEDFVFDRYAALMDRSSIPGKRAAAWTTAGSRRGAGGEVMIRRGLASLRRDRIPLDYVIIGEGWQNGLGDWGLPAPGFPSGMASLAAEIRGSGYTPGIWCAPFVAGPDSSVFRNRPEWLARGRSRSARPAGWLPRYGGTFFALDISRQDVRDHISRSLTRIIEEWDYGFVSLDLLYAAALYPPDGMSRGEAMAKAMDLLASLKGPAVFEYSSVPLESAFGRGEYCRIGADTTPKWESRFFRNIHSRERASTLNALRSTVGRRQLNGRFFSNSSDSFHLAERSSGMEPSRRYTQMLLHSLLTGLSRCSDDIGGYDREEWNAYASLFPVTEPRIDEVTESRRTVTVRYDVGDRNYVAIFNLAERVRPFELPEGNWFGAPGLKRRAHHIAGGGRQVLKPGESRNYMLLDQNRGFAGSDGHIYPGSEIESIERSDGRWNIRPARGVLRDFRVWMRCDGDAPAIINGEEAEIVETPFGIRLATAVVRRTETSRSAPNPAEAF